MKDRLIDVAALDALLADAGLTLKDLHQLTGISYSMLRKVHTGHRQTSLVNAARIARALGCHYYDFTWPPASADEAA